MTSTVPGIDDVDPPSQRRGFGIDVGGSGIKGAIVDLDTGQLIGDRIKLLTPQPATPDAVASHDIPQQDPGRDLSVDSAAGIRPPATAAAMAPSVAVRKSRRLNRHPPRPLCTAKTWGSSSA